MRFWDMTWGVAATTVHSCMDLRTGSDLQRSGTGVGPGSESKIGIVCMGTFKQGWTCKGPGPGSDPVPNWKSGGPCNYATVCIDCDEYLFLQSCP